MRSNMKLIRIFDIFQCKNIKKYKNTNYNNPTTNKIKVYSSFKRVKFIPLFHTKKSNRF